MSTITQQHPLVDGTTVEISRNGRHQYWVGDGPRMPSVTGLAKYIDGGDAFGAGMNWALKVVRENKGNLNAPRKMTRDATEMGNNLHEAIDNYITDGTITEDDPLFLAWFQIGQTLQLVEAERFLYHPRMQYGGTADAFSLSSSGGLAIHDWKTVNPDSWHKYGPSLRINKDSAQLAAYADALRAMGSIWVPNRGYLTYVLRDGSAAVVVEADLRHGLELFKASRNLFYLERKED